MADFSYEDFIGWGDPNQGDQWNSVMPADTPGWEDFTGWGGDETQQGWYQNADLDTSGQGGLWNTILGGLGGAGKMLLGGGVGGQSSGGLLGPLLSGAGSLAGGAIGSNAANDAARLQAAALNRGIDLSTSQWLNQLERTQPWVQAGQQAVGTLQGLAGQPTPSLPFQGGSGTVQGSWYGLPSATPGWQPEQYQGPQGPNAVDYRWNPQQGPQAQDYRYTPGQTPDAAQYQWTPGQGPQAQDYRYTPGEIPSAAQHRYTPGAVPTLSGKELLANDPGVQFRMDEGRKALEASAAARGGLLSGPTLAALQRQGQELSSQEYGNAWNRASQQAQLREQWGQAASTMGWQQAEGEARLREQVNQIASQQGWTQAQAAAAFREGLAQQSSQQGFSQAEAASRLREQVNQIASQQGWSQAQAESVFREQQAQLASQQGWNQALAGQQNQFTQGLDTSKWNTLQQQQYAQEQYKNMLEQSKLRYSQDVYANQTDYDRTQNLYKATYTTLTSLGTAVHFSPTWRASDWPTWYTGHCVKQRHQ